MRGWGDPQKREAWIHERLILLALNSWGLMTFTELMNATKISRSTLWRRLEGKNKGLIARGMIGEDVGRVPGGRVVKIKGRPTRTLRKPDGTYFRFVPLEDPIAGYVGFKKTRASGLNGPRLFESGGLRLLEIYKGSEYGPVLREYEDSLVGARNSRRKPDTEEKKKWRASLRKHEKEMNESVYYTYAIIPPVAHELKRELHPSGHI